MKEIGYIYLSWRQGPGKGRHIVGVLKRNATEGVRFSYISKEVEKAKKDGFTPYTEFPDLDKIYTDNVIEIFGQRITQSDRSDFSDFLQFWEVDPKYKDDKFYLLAHTQGLNPADNFEFLADYNPSKKLRFLTDLASLTVVKLDAGMIKNDDVLRYELDKGNEHDRFAVKVFKGDLLIGYIKKVHSRVFHKKGALNLTLKVKSVDQNGVIKRAFVKVSG